MISAFTLGEIAVKQADCCTAGGRHARRNKPALGVGRLTSKADLGFKQFAPAENRHTVVRLLPGPDRLVAHLPKGVARELMVLDFGFLECNQLRGMLVDDSLQLMQAGAHTVDIERDNLQVPVPFQGNDKIDC